jgi:DNA-binding LacI/PurR family transcriptional regulator
MHVRMKDIAVKLGVSLVTIARFCTNRPDIAKRLGNRVLKRVKKLRYQPNVAARSWPPDAVTSSASLG